MSETVAATLEVDEVEPTDEQPTEGKQQEKTEAAPKESDAAEAASKEAAAPEDGEKEEPVKEKPQQSDPEEPEDDVPIVLVTGASGFLGSHVVKQLVEDGRFRVRGTVRSLNNEKKVNHLREIAKDAEYPLRLIEADLLKPSTWIEATRRCRYVYHVASPVTPPKSKNPDYYIKPAVDGTLNVLKACTEAGTVKRVVLTSSLSAVADIDVPAPTADYVYTEADFHPGEGRRPYDIGKTKAEKSAWEYVKELEKEKQFELAVICPGVLEGPVFCPAHKDSSVLFIEKMMSGKLSRLPDIRMPFGDVRDCAKTHIVAMEKSEAAGNRYLCFTGNMTFKQVAQLLAEEFRPQGYKIGTKDLPKAMMWAAKLVSSQAKEMYPMVGKRIEYSNEKMTKELGIEPRPLKETILDVSYSLIEIGVVPKKPGYLGHPSTRPPPPEPEAESKTEEAADQSEATKELVKAEEETKDEPATDAPVQSEQTATAEEEKPSEAPPIVDEKPAEDPTKEETEKPAEELPKSEEPPAKPEEPPSEEPAKPEVPPSEEPPKTDESPKADEPSEEPPKVDEPPSEEPPKADEPPSEEPPKVDESPSEEPAAKAEEPSSEEPTTAEEPAKEEPESAPEPPQEEAPPAQEPEPEPKEEPSTETTTAQEEQQPPAQDTPAEPTSEEPTETPAEEEQKDTTTADNATEQETEANTES